VTGTGTSAAQGLKARLAAELEGLKAGSLYKEERVIAGPQGTRLRLADGREVLNFCANNYLGLANHPAVLAGAKAALDNRGYGMASVRFICGTQDLHRRLEERLASFLGKEAAILYGSCFDANGGLFETLLDERDAVISDALNHASVIDGIRLCKARRYRYAHADMNDLAAQLEAASDARTRLIATDGVFSMDGDMAPLDKIAALARSHGALVMVDDSHATGFVGPGGRGSAAHFGVEPGIDIVTTTLGKALGGGAGGVTAASAEVVALLRQRSRPYLFSNALPPPVVGASLAALDLIEASGHDDLRRRLEANANRFREGLTKAGFDLKPGRHPIVPVMLHDAERARCLAEALLERGIYVVAFSYPVVPKGEARIRVQLSAAHTAADIDQAVSAFIEASHEVGARQ
jgi:glycine C-acetyltransferase